MLQSHSAPQAGAGETQSHKGPWINITGGLELNSGSGIFLRWKEHTLIDPRIDMIDSGNNHYNTESSELTETKTCHKNTIFISSMN